MYMDPASARTYLHLGEDEAVKVDCLMTKLDRVVIRAVNGTKPQRLEHLRCGTSAVLTLLSARSLLSPDQADDFQRVVERTIVTEPDDLGSLRREVVKPIWETIRRRLAVFQLELLERQCQALPPIAKSKACPTHGRSGPRHLSLVVSR